MNWREKYDLNLDWDFINRLSDEARTKIYEILRNENIQTVKDVGDKIPRILFKDGGRFILKGVQKFFSKTGLFR